MKRRRAFSRDIDWLEPVDDPPREALEPTSRSAQEQREESHHSENEGDEPPGDLREIVERFLAHHLPETHNHDDQNHQGEHRIQGTIHRSISVD